MNFLFHASHFGIINSNTSGGGGGDLIADLGPRFWWSVQDPTLNQDAGGTPQTTDDADIEKLADKSGNGFHLLRTGTGAVLKTSAYPGHQAIRTASARFSNDGLTIPMDHYTVAIVHREVTHKDYAGIFVLGSSGSGNDFDGLSGRAVLMTQTATEEGYFVTEGCAISIPSTTTSPPTVPVVTICKVDGTDVTVKSTSGSVSGTRTITGTTSPAGFGLGTRFYSGAWTTSPGDYFDGDVFEYIIFDKTLTTLEENSLFDLLTETYGGGGPEPEFPGTGIFVMMPDQNDSILNATGDPCGHLETVATIQDRSGNGHHATQSTDENRALYLAHGGTEADNYLLMLGRQFVVVAGNDPIFGTAQVGNPTEISYHDSMEISGRLVLAMRIASDVWARDPEVSWLAGRDRTSNAVWRVRINPDGAPVWVSWVSGIGEVYHTCDTSLTTVVADGAPVWLAFDHDPATPEGTPYNITSINKTGGNFQVRITGNPFVTGDVVEIRDTESHFVGVWTVGASYDSTEFTVDAAVVGGDQSYAAGTARLASRSRARFFTSTDGTSWTQLGSDATTALHTRIACTAPLEIGSVANGYSIEGTNGDMMFKGRFFALKLISGDLDTGTTVIDWRAEDAEHLAYTSFCRTGPGVMRHRNSMLVGQGALLTRYLTYYELTGVTVPDNSLAGLRYHAWTKAEVSSDSGGIIIGLGASTDFPYMPYLPVSPTLGGYAAFVAGSSFNAAISGAWREKLSKGGTFVFSPDLDAFKLNGATTTDGIVSGPSTSVPATLLFRRNPVLTENAPPRIAVGRYGVFTGTNLAAVEAWAGPHTESINLLSHSQDLWVPGDGSVMGGWGYLGQGVIPNVGVGPAATGAVQSADYVYVGESSSPYYHYMYQALAVEAGPYCLSAYVKRPPVISGTWPGYPYTVIQPYDFFALKISDGVSYNQQAVFNTTTGANTFLSPGMTNVVAEDVGDGWWRFSVVWAFASSHSAANIGLDLVLEDGTFTHTGWTSYGLYVTGVKFNPGTAPGLYCPTTTSPMV